MNKKTQCIFMVLLTLVACKREDSQNMREMDSKLEMQSLSHNEEGASPVSGSGLRADGVMVGVIGVSAAVGAFFWSQGRGVSSEESFPAENISLGKEEHYPFESESLPVQINGAPPVESDSSLESYHTGRVNAIESVENLVEEEFSSHESAVPFSPGHHLDVEHAENNQSGVVAAVAVGAGLVLGAIGYNIYKKGIEVRRKKQEYQSFMRQIAIPLQISMERSGLDVLEFQANWTEFVRRNREMADATVIVRAFLEKFYDQLDGETTSAVVRHFEAQMRVASHEFLPFRSNNFDGRENDDSQETMESESSLESSDMGEEGFVESVEDRASELGLSSETATPFSASQSLETDQVENHHSGVKAAFAVRAGLVLMDTIYSSYKKIIEARRKEQEYRTFMHQIAIPLKISMERAGLVVAEFEANWTDFMRRNREIGDSTVIVKAFLEKSYGELGVEAISKVMSDFTAQMKVASHEIEVSDTEEEVI